VWDLFHRKTQDMRAPEPVALFCYNAKRRIGSFAAALGSVDTLVFAGGIGEDAPVVRARICGGLSPLGIEVIYVQQSRRLNPSDSSPGLGTDCAIKKTHNEIFSTFQV